MKKNKKVIIKDVSMPTKVKQVNPRGATVLINQPKGKKKVGLYGLV